MLEADKNSNGGKSIKPSVETLLKVSYAVGIPLGELLRKLGDEEIDLRKSEFSEEETELVDGYRGLTDEGKRLVVGMIRQLNFGRAVNQSAAQFCYGKILATAIWRKAALQSLWCF